MTLPFRRRSRPRFNGSPSDHAPTQQWLSQLRTDDMDGATYKWGGANDIGVMAIATFTHDVAAPLAGYRPALSSFPALPPAPGPQPAPCRRTNPHTPHDTPGGRCPGTAPEFPSEPIEVVSAEPLPDWERDLLDEQARQIALPVLRDVPVTERAVIGDDLRLPVIWCEMPGCISWGYDDTVSAGYADSRRSAIAAGWRYDALGRLACTTCQQTRPDYDSPQPVAWRHPSVRRHWNWADEYGRPNAEVQRRWAAGEYIGEPLRDEDMKQLGQEAEYGRQISYENPAIARAIAGATARTEGAS